MPSKQETQRLISQNLDQFAQGSLRENSLRLLESLGYKSERQLELDGRPDQFLDYFTGGRQDGRFQPARALVPEWQSAHILFQLTDDDIRQSHQMILMESDGRQVDGTIMRSYLFTAVRLADRNYSRSELAQITREMNKLLDIPVLVLFQHGTTLSFAVINRRLGKRDPNRDVLEKVTLIKEIRLHKPHRAHLEILFDLSLAELHRVHGFQNFVELHRAWEKTLDSNELNRKFFREIADWYFWAVDQVAFPPAAGPEETRSAASVIRLITRLIFVWFLKEKGLVPDALFNRRALDKLLIWEDPQESAYYKAILQNLFFATLNQEMNSEAKPDNRKFRHSREKGQSQHYMIHNLYRYERYFADPAAALALFANIPFLNGGLFECLDRKGEDGVIRVDAFSDRPDNPLRVPDDLFFGDPRPVDLNETYGTRGKMYKAEGLIRILNRYKFTVAENTPIEEEIALDPELLGKVFENLLAAYNPETGTTARKQTGSFYTPRAIVDYMVDESLVAYLAANLTGLEGLSGLEERLRHLLAYNEEPPQFNQAEKEALIVAINQAKILDPACGSGAFPMGVLHKLVFILGKLDPDNRGWRALQRQKAVQETEEAYQLGDRREREERLLQINDIFERNASDYGRKLYLIENCIYGVDIQPIAVQIAKLRFFISLVVDQRINDDDPNRGVMPLPNLETKFVAANTLLGIEKSAQMGLRNPAIAAKEKELAGTRSRHFRARTPATKEKWRLADKRLRGEIGDLLQNDGFPNEVTTKLANWDPYNQNAAADFFDPEWMYGLTSGFDMVIGNPPYVRQEKIKELKPALQRQYSCFTGVADLYVYFFEGGYNLLRENGVLTYICSNKYFRAGYGRKLRAFLAKQTTVRQLLDFGDAPVFTAIAYPSIIVLQKKPPQQNRLVAFNWRPEWELAEFGERLAAERFKMTQAALTADGWRLEQPETLALLEKLRRAGKPLGKYVNERFYYGIKTGLNEAFVVDRATRDQLIAADPASADILQPFLRGRDVKRWQVTFADQYLIKIESSANKIHPWSGKPDSEAERIFAESYPAVYAHLEQYRDKLIKRYDQGKFFWELRACAYWDEFEQPKIVYPDIAQDAEFCFDNNGYFVVNTMYLMPTDEVWLVGLLNSKAIFWFYTQISTKIRGGFVRFIAQYVSEIPVPESKDTSKIDALSRKILAIRQANPAADVTDLEQQIDAHVYALYNLTPAEIALIEGREPPAGSDRFSGQATAEAVTTNAVMANAAASIPLLFVGQPPQGSFPQRLKRVTALAKQSTPAAVQELTAALADENQAIRWLARGALQKVGGPEVTAVVQSFLAQTDDPIACAEAEKLLRQLLA
jgi:adenine-specific DNA-methyltransferase